MVIIPARMASTRLPGKPLADIAGQPMIVHCWRRAVEAEVGPVVVAGAEPEIAAAVEAAGGTAVLTAPELPSGSDRAAAALAAVDPDGSHDAVVNLQGAAAARVGSKAVIRGDGEIVGWIGGGCTTGAVRKAVSGYTLREGDRPGGDGNPGGAYDGTYVDDWAWTGVGDLDECNGMIVNGQYGYYVTDSYPWLIACLSGDPDPSFDK